MFVAALSVSGSLGSKSPIANPRLWKDGRGDDASDYVSCQPQHDDPGNFEYTNTSFFSLLSFF